VTEAVTLLAARGPGARLLAGGQTLMPLMARRIERPDWVIDINRIDGLDQSSCCPRISAWELWYVRNKLGAARWLANTLQV
jgi:hypothetical protein